MNKISKYLALAAAGLALAACSEPEPFEPSGDEMFTIPVDVEVTVSDYDSSRAPYELTSSDYINLALNFTNSFGEATIWGYLRYSDGSGWTMSFSTTPTQSTTYSYTAYFIPGKTRSYHSGSDLTLEPTDAVYSCQGVFDYIHGGTPSLTLDLQPVYGRLQLRGSSRSTVYFAGPTVAQYLGYAPAGIHEGPVVSRSVSIRDVDGSYVAPYIYGRYDRASAKRYFKIRTGNDMFFRSMTSVADFMAEGKSGYIDIPTSENPGAWTADTYTGNSYNNIYGNNLFPTDTEYYEQHLKTFPSRCGFHIYGKYHLYSGGTTANAAFNIRVLAFDEQPSDVFSATPLASWEFSMFPYDTQASTYNDFDYQNEITMPGGRPAYYAVIIAYRGVQLYFDQFVISNF